MPQDAETLKALCSIRELAFQMTLIMDPDYTHPNVGAIIDWCDRLLQPAASSEATPGTCATCRYLKSDRCDRAASPMSQEEVAWVFQQTFGCTLYEPRSASSTGKAT